MLWVKKPTFYRVFTYDEWMNLRKAVNKPPKVVGRTDLDARRPYLFKTPGEWYFLITRWIWDAKLHGVKDELVWYYMEKVRENYIVSKKTGLLTYKAKKIPGEEYEELERTWPIPKPKEEIKEK